MKPFFKIGLLLLLAIFSNTHGKAQPSDPSNYCQWMGRDSFKYKELKVCDGAIVSAGREGVYFPGYTYKWYNGATTHWFTFNNQGLYWVDISKDGCTGRDSLRIIYVTPPKVNLGNDTLLCIGDSLVLDAGNPGSTYSWNNNFSPNQSQTFVVRNPGRYTVIVNAPGCSKLDTIQVNYKAPSNYSFGPDRLICEEDTVSLYFGGTDAKYLWQDGSTRPIFYVTGAGTYSVRIDDACGIYYDTIIFTSSNCKLYVPTAFTPNNDGKNDVLRVLGYDSYSFFRFTIYNRWGGRVFISQAPEKGWNGFLNGQPQPQGAYVWTLEYKKKNKSKTFLQKGTATLIR